MDSQKIILLSGYVYRLTCDDPNLVYYGSTIQTLQRRFSFHKSDFKNNKGCCASKKIFQVGGVEIELVLEVEVSSRRELQEIEQTYIDNDVCVNKIASFKTREEMKEYSKEYKQTEKYKQYKKEYDKKYRESKKIKNI